MGRENNKSSLLFLLFFVVIVAFLAMYFMQIGPFKNNAVDSVATEIKEPSYSTARVSVGGSVKLNAEGTNKDLKWVSADESIASVNDGVVRGNKQGTTTISVYVDDRVVAKCEVIVYAAEEIDDQEPVQPENPEEPELILPESISVNQEDVSLNVGESKIIVATILPENTSDNVVNWSSSDESVVSVLYGEITGNKVGNATITASTNNGKTATVKVTVKEQQVSFLKLNMTNATIVVGNKLTLKAISLPSNKVDKSVTWSSSNDSIATVSNGVVTGKKAGKVTITAKSNNGKTASAVINVISASSPKVGVSKIALKPESTSILVGQTVIISATVSPSNATDQKITWSSSNSDVLEVTEGIGYGNKAGTATVTARTSNGKTASVTITVKAIQPSSINLNKKEITIKIGSTSTLQATVLPNNASNKTVAWSSSDPTVASVDKGVVTGKKAGKANISATTYNGHTTLCVVNVQPINVTGIKLNSSAGTINVGKTYQLKATISPSNATNKTVKWASSDPTVATVSSSGLVTGKKAGTAVITATANNGLSAIYKATIVVPVSGVTIKLNNKAVTTASTTIGSSVQLTAVVSPSNATNKTVTWKSSNAKIATVNSSGKVTTKRTGTVNITAKTNNGKTATVKVTITGHRIHFLKTNGGDSILLESNNSFALVDAGTASSKTLIENYLNKYDIKTLDFMIITHKHSDHLGSAEYIANKFTIKKLYIKKYIQNDSGKGTDSWNKNRDSYNSLVKKFDKKIVYVNDTYKETAKTSKSINFGGNSKDNMKIFFYNTNQRMRSKDKCGGKTFVSYEKDSCYGGESENNNSIVNLIQVNGHNVLLTGDMTNMNVWKALQETRLKGITIDVFKVPHHAVYNCVGNIKPGKPAIFTLTKKDIKYYQVTGSVNGGGTNSSIPAPTLDFGYQSGGQTEANKRRSCFNNLAYNFKKNATEKEIKAEAKEILCNRSYFSRDTDSANVYNLSNKEVKKPSGDGAGSYSKYCK